MPKGPSVSHCSDNSTQGAEARNACLSACLTARRSQPRLYPARSESKRLHPERFILLKPTAAVQRSAARSVGVRAKTLEERSLRRRAKGNRDRVVFLRT
jgi:hypothetical protein